MTRFSPFLMLSLVALFIAATCSCNVVGKPDPVHRSFAFDVVELLDLMYEGSEDPGMVESLTYSVEARIDEEVPNLKSYSEVDRTKIDRIGLGVVEIRNNADVAAYVRQRSRSLATLVGSVGLYEDSEFYDELQDFINTNFGNDTETEEENEEGGSDGGDETTAG